jgi:hypothetical protein
MLDEIVKSAKAIDIKVIAWRVLSRHTDEMTDLQKSRLHRGERTDKKQLPPYSKPYIPVRVKYGRPISPKDLDLTGQHHDAMFTTTSKDYTLMGSSDWKQNILEWAWGDEIYGLSEEDMDIILWESGAGLEMAEEFNRDLMR